MINSKPLIVMKLKNSNSGETQKLKWGGNGNETQKPKLWWNWKTQIVMKFKNSILMKLRSSNCDETHNSNYDKT